MLPAPPTALDVFIARQPIFDLTGRRVAYELLYRATARSTNASCAGEEFMCNDTALHSLVSIGFERLTVGSVGFVNVTREHLAQEYFRIFDPRTVVLELLESIEPDDEVLDIIRRASADGYTFALDDYDGRASLDALLPLVSIVKLDVLGRSRGELEPVVGRLRSMGLTVLAERVETAEERNVCSALGCELFQGYYFSRPEVLNGRTLSVQDTAILRILSLVSDPSITASVLEEAFRSHPSLSHALLRIVKSAAIGVSSVHSIPHALRVIGHEALARWMMVMLVGSIATQDPVAQEEVLRTLTRARFLELVSERPDTGFSGGCSSSDAAERFLTGILSRMDVLLGMTVSEVIERLPVDVEVRLALLEGRGAHACVLAMARAYEAGDWDAVESYREGAAQSGVLLDTYCEAAQWASQCLAA